MTLPSNEETADGLGSEFDGLDEGNDQDHHGHLP
jgi:hypothetical protein